jgi:hypothetical protein
MIIVCDSSPIIALALCGQLELVDKSHYILKNRLTTCSLMKRKAEKQQ